MQPPTQQGPSGAPIVRRVLVVDDHPAVPLALTVAFRSDGRFAVADSAATCAEGLSKLTDQDAVLLDLCLPDADGSVAVRAFRERRPSIPLILHSAADETPGVEAVREMVDAVVLKSRFDDVLAALTRLTEA